MADQSNPADAKATKGGSPKKDESVHYETRDVRFRWVLYGAIAFSLLGIVMHVALYAYHQWQLDRHDRTSESTFPLAPSPSADLPPEPRLGPLEQLEGEEIPRNFAWYESAQQQLHRYGNTSEKAYVHIPIEKAMEVLAGDLPVRENADDDSRRDNGLVDYGEPNAGRLFRKVPE